MMDQSQNSPKNRKRTPYFLLLSLFLHALVITIFAISKSAPPPPRSAKVEVQYLTPEELAPAKTKAEKAAKVQLDQVVEQQKRINEEKDKDSRFLSAFDQKVVKETVAERSGKFKNTAKGGQPDEGAKDG